MIPYSQKASFKGSIKGILKGIFRGYFKGLLKGIYSRLTIPWQGLQDPLLPWL